MACKIMELEEVVRSIPDGAELALGSFAITRNPVAFSNELIRQKKRNLKILEIIGSMDADMLVGAGCVDQLTYGGGSLDRFGRINRINEAIEKKSIKVWEYSGLGMTMSFLAGSLGIPFIPSKTMLGTDILKNLIDKGAPVKVNHCPFTGEKVVLFRGLRPEYAVVHAPAADDRGNILIKGPVWEEELAKAADRLIVTVDHLVSNEFVKRNPYLVKIPNVYTYAVIPVPYGAYPTSVYGEYDYDDEFITLYAEANRSQESFNKFIDTYVYGTKNHTEFILKACGFDRLTKLKADPVFGYRKF